MRAFCYSIRNMNYSQLLSTIGIINLKPCEIDQSQSKRIDYD